MSGGAERIGLVLAGGGARGAYEAGALSVLLPVLERRGELPSVVVGTSVGAINAVHLAANLHRGAEEATALMVERWSQVSMAQVLRPVVLRQAPRTALLYAADALGMPWLTLRALLDPSPLQRTLAEWIDWRALHRNVRRGLLDAVGVVATSVASERSVVFVEGGGRLPRDGYRVGYAAARLDQDHVRASAAIPTIFPAVRVERPADQRGFYFDGGTRLNTPIKPVIDLGAERVVVVATHSIAQQAREEGPEPDFADGAVELIQATLVDPLIEDIRMLGKMNLLLEGIGGRAEREGRRRGWRRIPHLFVGPAERGALGRVARDVLEREFSGLRRLRSPDLSFIGRLVGGRSENQGELLSYLFFRSEFTRALIQEGRRDAEERLAAAGDDLWRLDPVEG